MATHSYKAENWTSNPERFFRELPEDWVADARSLWPRMAAESQIWVLTRNGKFRAGGVLTRAMLPEMERYRSVAEGYYKRNYWYVGFLFVDPKSRGEGLGSRWLEAAWDWVPARGIWLTIETIDLLKFYTRNGFQLDQILHNGEAREWLLARPR